MFIVDLVIGAVFLGTVYLVNKPFNRIIEKQKKEMEDKPRVVAKGYGAIEVDGELKTFSGGSSSYIPPPT